jgi:hypothetical protein
VYEQRCRLCRLRVARALGESVTASPRPRASRSTVSPPQRAQAGGSPLTGARARPRYQHGKLATYRVPERLIEATRLESRRCRGARHRTLGRVVPPPLRSARAPKPRCAPRGADVRLSLAALSVGALSSNTASAELKPSFCATGTPLYCEAWNGAGAYTYDRIGRGTLHIRAACLSVLGGIQPGPLER